MRLKADDRYHYRLAQLLKYNETHGTMDVPYNYDQDRQLAKWVQSQRYEYRLLQKESTSSGLKSHLTPHRVELLDVLGFPWKDECSETSFSSSTSKTFLSHSKWLKKFKLLQEYKEEFHHIRISEKQIYKGVNLGVWVKHQRRNYKESNNAVMTPARIEKLNSIGFIWDTRTNGDTVYNMTWLHRYEQLKEFHHKHGHFLIPTKNKSLKELATWVKTQRVLYKQWRDKSNVTYTGSFGEERIHLMNAIGFDWEGLKSLDLQRNVTWWNRFEELKCFREIHGHLDLDDASHSFALSNPQNLTWNGNVKKLRHWMNTQRTSYRKFHTNGESTSMNLERIKALSSIGFVWNKRTSDWDTMYKRLLSYKAKYGTCDVHLIKTVHDSDHIDWKHITELGKWTWSQRITYKMYINGEWLHNDIKECMIKLEKIDFMTQATTDGENDSFDGHLYLNALPIKNASSKSERKFLWNSKFAALEAFYNTHGHTMVPRNYYDQDLVQWIFQQRRRMANIQMKLDQKRSISPMDVEHRRRLMALDFVTNAHDYKFEISVKKLAEFRSIHGHTRVTEKQDHYLHCFVRRQRELYKALENPSIRNSLSPKRMQMLNDIDFVWRVQETNQE